jgi:hypothetical protein
LGGVNSCQQREGRNDSFPHEVPIKHPHHISSANTGSSTTCLSFLS